MTKNKHISHFKWTQEGLVLQDNKEHSVGVAEMARKFAEPFGMGDVAYLMGFLHDKGKESNAFQNHIRYAAGLDPDVLYTKEESRHSYVGGLELINKASSDKTKQLIVAMCANGIIGHHRGLYDYMDLKKQFEKPIPEGVEGTDEYDLPKMPTEINNNKIEAKDIHHIQRMLFSCLVDADFLDTERFMQPEAYNTRGRGKALYELLPLLEAKIASFPISESEVSKVRQCVQRFCRIGAIDKGQFFNLTVPTGGAKTLSSLLWALLYAMVNHKRRIIIAIPYTSIIVQTASVLRGIFGNENVLEHHSNADWASMGKEMERKMSMAAENWDYPIVVTTNVQLFESMFSNRPSSCRKLHNICNSVVIMDEVQTLEPGYLLPIVDSIGTYGRLFGTAFLFTTASQPILEGQHQGVNPFVVFKGLDSIKEIVPKEEMLYNRMRRCRINRGLSGSYDLIANKLQEHNDVLCITNTRQCAAELFKRLPDTVKKIHLSRNMCSKHIAAKLNEIKRMRQEGIFGMRVVSTQLIEAGVDIDFPVVYRQEAGLDSILQAAGRCNREGKLKGLGEVNVFKIYNEGDFNPKSLTRNIYAMQQSIKGRDWFAPETMHEYFRQLYSRIDSFDIKKMKDKLYNPATIMFETASNEFRLIEDKNRVSIIVKYGESGTIIAKLLQEGSPTYEIMKELGGYTVDVSEKDFRKLMNEGKLETVMEGIFVAKEDIYDDDLGLIV